MGFKLNAFNQHHFTFPFTLRGSDFTIILNFTYGQDSFVDNSARGAGILNENTGNLLDDWNIGIEGDGLGFAFTTIFTVNGGAGTDLKYESVPSFTTTGERMSFAWSLNHGTSTATWRKNGVDTGLNGTFGVGGGLQSESVLGRTGVDVGDYAPLDNVEEMWVYDRVLVDNELKLFTLLDNPDGIVDTSLIGHYKPVGDKDGLITGEKIIDLSGKGNHFTPLNSGGFY